MLPDQKVMLMIVSYAGSMHEVSVTEQMSVCVNPNILFPLQGVAADNTSLSQLCEALAHSASVSCSCQPGLQQNWHGPLLAVCCSLRLLINNFQGMKTERICNGGLSSVVLVIIFMSRTC